MSVNNIDCDVLVIGGGAAGLFCAIEAGKRGCDVIVLEKNPNCGRKIIISGGGRCNFTNLSVTAENFVSKNPHFVKSALAAYSSQDFIEFIKRNRIRYYEKTLGQLFCKGRSNEILELLLKEAENAGVRIVTSVEIEKIDQDFTTYAGDNVYRPKKLVVACGGKSFPKVGATGFGYDVARQFGHELVEIRPSLVPLRFAKKNFGDLAGVSLEAIGETNGKHFRENILFTHQGLSGPLVLQLSNYWNPDSVVELNLLPDVDVTVLLEQSRTLNRNVGQTIKGVLPRRFIEMYFHGKLLNRRLTEVSKADVEKIARSLNNWKVSFDETEGWHKAEVTLGGVDTKGLDSKTMESRKVPGLYFIGEVVDVTGWLGGYNFQWAWSSGFVCGNAV